VSRDYSDEARRLSIMLGNLMSDHRDPAGRKLDAQLGAPRSRSEAKRIVEQMASQHCSNRLGGVCGRLHRRKTRWLEACAATGI